MYVKIKLKTLTWIVFLSHKSLILDVQTANFYDVKCLHAKMV